MSGAIQKKIFHIGAWNRNIGDWAAGYNLHRMLEDEAIGQGFGVSFHPVDSQRGVFHESLVKQINEEGDMLLVGGGGMIFNRPQDQSISGWAFNITEDLLNSIEVPMIVYAIGYNKFYFDLNEWPSSMGSHLRTTQDKSHYFSVRDEGSRDCLISEFQLSSSNIDVIPDPGVCLYDRYIEIPGLEKGKRLIALNWAGDRPEERFASPWEENRTFFVHSLRAALIRATRELNCQVLFVPHLEDLDVPFYDELNIGFENNNLLNLAELLPHLYPPAGEMLYYNVPFFTNIYRQADLTLGMRGHSCIFSFGAGTPFIPIGSHNKVMYFADEVEMTKYSIRMISRDTDNEESMFSRIRDCLDDSEYKTLIDSSLKKQIETLRVTNKAIVSRYL